MYFLLVVGLEPTRELTQRILIPQRLPISSYQLMAVGVGFEPTSRFRLLVFKTSAFSQTLPSYHYWFVFGFSLSCVSYSSNRCNAWCNSNRKLLDVGLLSLHNILVSTISNSVLTSITITSNIYKNSFSQQDSNLQYIAVHLLFFRLNYARFFLRLSEVS